jgi:hypothetical protein
METPPQGGILAKDGIHPAHGPRITETEHTASFNINSQFLILNFKLWWIFS